MRDALHCLDADVMGLLVQRLALRDIYALRRTSAALNRTVGRCQETLTHHHDTFLGVHAANLRVFARDMPAIRYTPCVLGRMNVEQLDVFVHAYRPDYLRLDAHTVTECAYARALRALPECVQHLEVVVDQRSLRALHRVGALNVESLRVVGDDRLTADLLVEWLRVRHAPVRALEIHAPVCSVRRLLDALPRALRALTIFCPPWQGDESPVGEWLRAALELGLDELQLHRCYEINDVFSEAYTDVAAAVEHARRLPRRLALSPAPYAAVERALRRGCDVLLQECNFLDDEWEHVADNIGAVAEAVAEAPVESEL